MDKIQEKKFQILNDVCTSKDGLSWNELTEDLNELIEIVSSSTQKNEIVPPDVIARFSNSHGWISYSKFNEWMKERGFNVTELERHNRTDGEVHFRYRHKITSQTFDFNGNYWSGESFGKVVEWLNQNGL